MQMSYTLMVVATLAQFILGGLWYSPLMFGKLWMKIMGAGECSEEEKKKMQKQMVPFYLLQILLTFIFTFILVLFLEGIPSPVSYIFSSLIFIGFIVPTQISGVIWGSTKKEFWLKQILVMVSYQLVGVMLATFILSF